MEKKASKLKPRVHMPEQPPLERVGNFSEVTLGYSLEMAKEEAARCLQCKKPLCERGCPVEVPIKAFIGHLAKGDVVEAYRAIRETNSLPAVCGRVCPQEVQCEGACVLNKKGQAVCIGRLERFTADEYAARSACEQLTGTKACPMIREELKVACIGAGPSSLTVAGYLSTLGIKVHVYEALHEPGGVLVYGIPEFRLPKAIVKREVEAMTENGVEFHLNWVGGRTVTVRDLFDEGFQAVFIGVGAGLPKFLKVPGEDLTGVFSANEYLSRANLGRAYAFPDYDTPPFPGRNVVVVGGGNVAMDAARTAMRMGADKVSLVYRRTKNEMPCRLEELEHAVDEGLHLEVLTNPVEFVGDETGRVTGVRLERMCLGEPDEKGRRSPNCTGDYFDIPCDLAVIAVGTGPNPLLLEATPGLERNRWGYIQVNEETGETSIPNVFAGGDIVTGAATVILAMGAGRRAAKEIARRLLGGDAPQDVPPLHAGAGGPQD
ncbi:MAG: NADPH-dependent glutamate synthase [Thermodesulfobacteriota bacterium]